MFWEEIEKNRHCKSERPSSMMTVYSFLCGYVLKLTLLFDVFILLQFLFGGFDVFYDIHPTNFNDDEGYEENVSPFLKIES